ncbi:MAG: tRNA (N6-threonylcarbamoyladenosine(37)-N6)-methyltransferase TrmO [Desulfurococcales archaeon]|nr:tRNA (N6-threonylcarbamoyladenosine(37)-N6)-methyltransferase TrmO [Desulfurococcales archaeon]
MRICMEPIGYVEEGLPEDRGRSRYQVDSVIRVKDKYARGLEGLEGYSHAFIIYWMHRAPEPMLKWRPWRRTEYPEVGVFATRFPGRPNPIGLSLVEVLRVEPPRLVVRGLDAWTGTPVLDVKPYDYHDVACCPRVPGWVRDRWEEDRDRYAREAPWMGPRC